MKRFVVVLGIVLALAGLVVAFTPLNVTSGGQTVSCGGAFDDLGHGDAFGVDSDNAFSNSLVGGDKPTGYTDKCESKQSTFSILAGVAGVVGVALLAAGSFIPTRRRSQEVPI